MKLSEEESFYCNEKGFHSLEPHRFYYSSKTLTTVKFLGRQALQCESFRYLFLFNNFIEVE